MTKDSLNASVARIAGALTFSLATLLGGSLPVRAQDALVPGKVTVIKPSKLAKFVSGKIPLPPPPDPTASGATLRFLDTGGGAGDLTVDLPAGQWQGLGNPPGAKGYKYKGAGSATDQCKVVLIKQDKFKGVCKGAGITLANPFTGGAAIVLAIGGQRYCAEFGTANIQKNEPEVFKGKDAPAPPACAGEPLPTPTATPPSGPTCSPTPTSTPGGGGNCGNGLLEGGETCGSCPQDCMILPCNSPGNPQRTFRVNFTSPPFQDATSTTVLIAYRSNLVNIPGSGNAGSVDGSITMRQSSTTVTPNDLDYALRVVYSRAAGVNPLQRLFNLVFNSCLSAPAPALADFACTVTGCSNVNGDIAGCTCAVAAP